MPLIKKEKLKNTLEILNNIGEVRGSSVISTDGLCIESAMGEDNDVETIAAMTAAMQGAAETAVFELKQGNLKQIIVGADKGKIIAISAGDGAILVILTTPKINLGLALFELRKASRKISNILGE